MGKSTKYQPPVQDNFIVSLLHLHSFRHIISSLLHPVSKEQFYDLPKNLKPADNYKTYLKTKSTFTMNPKKQNLPWILLKAFKLQFFVAAVFTIVATILAMIGPLLMKKVIYYLQKKKSLPLEFSSARNYLLIWLGVFLAKLFINEIGDKLFFNVGLKVDEALIEDITRKVVRLPTTIKNNIPKAEMMNYVMVDVKLVGYFFKYVTHGLAAPTALIIGTFLMLGSGQSYTIIMTFALIAITYGLRMLSDVMSNKKREKLGYQYERLNSNTELVSQIKELRQVGYQDLIVNRTRFFRQKQNALNYLIYCLVYIYDTILALIPLIIISIVLLKQKFDPTDKTISAGELYTIFNYAALIGYPLKYLRSFFNSFNDMMFALKRLQEFLIAPEVDITYPLLKQELQPGELAIQNLAIPQDSLDDRHQYLGPKEYKPKGELTLQLTLQFQKGDKITVLSKKGEGRILLAALGGLVNIREGRVSYGGSIVYSPSKPWLLKASIADNITYSRVPEADKLTVQQVCSICDLTDDLANLPDGLHTILADIHPLSYSTTKKLQLARYLHSNADIFLLDDPFEGMEHGAAQTILHNIRQKMSTKTIVLACNNPELLSPEDNVIIFHQNNASAYGRVEELLRDEHSIINQYIRQNDRNLQRLSASKKQQGDFGTKQDIHKHEGHDGHEKHEKHEQHGEHHVEGQHQDDEHGAAGHGHDGHHGAHHGHEIHGHERQSRIPLKKYWRLFNASHSNLLKIIVILLIVAQLLKGYASWWVSHISHHHGKIKVKQQLSNANVFIQATILFALVHFLQGMLSAYLSKTNSDNFSEHTMKSLARSNMQFFETHDLIVVALKSNKDFEDTFTITYYFQTILRNALLFVIMCVSLGLETPEFVAVGLIIGLSGIVIYLNFSRAEREIMRYFTPTYEESQKEFQQYIDGIDTVKPLGAAKIDKLRKPWDQKMHDLFVIRLNQKYIYQGLNMACELISLLVPFLPAFYALHNKKLLDEHGIHVFITIIIYATKLCGMMTALVKDAAYVENTMRLSIKKNLDLIELSAHKDHAVVDDVYWPGTSEVYLDRVAVGSDRCQRLELKESTIDFGSGEKVFLLGKQADGVNAIKQIITRSGQKWEQERGQVIVSGKPARSVQLKQYVESVMHLTSNPLTFTGTLRQNIDPLDEFSNRAILKVLTLLNFESLISYSSDNSRKLGILNQKLSFERTTKQMGNSINIARALLRQPMVVVCDNINPNQCDVSALSTLSSRLNESTIIVEGMNVADAFISTRIIVFSRGEVVEEGSPDQLIRKESKFKQFVEHLPVYSRPVPRVG